MDLWLDAADLRDYMGTSVTTSRYSDRALGSNIRAAQGLMERQTSRQFDLQSGVSKTFSTDGKAVVAIPDLRTATSVTLQEAALASGTTYWLLPDTRHSGVHVAVQVRPFGTDYRGNPEWFDRNLDRDWYARGEGHLPNDLVIVGDWGWTSKPDDLLMGVKALAAWMTKRADAVLAGAVQNADGSIMDYSRWPEEAQAARSTYLRGTQMESV